MFEKEAKDTIEELEQQNEQLKQQIEKECDFKQAHLSGLNIYEPKWHKVTDGDLPKEKKEYWCKIFHYKTQETFIAFLCFDPSTKEFKFLGNLEVDEFSVEEWCELPKEVKE